MTTGREYDEATTAGAGDVLVEVSEDAAGELVANVTWGDWISDGITRHGDSVGPMSVGEALTHADEVAELYGFDRVVVSLPGAEAWNPTWGTLRRQPAGFEEADDGDEGRTPFIEPTEDDDGLPVRP
jgi:hypothetical protein